MGLRVTGDGHQVGGSDEPCARRTHDIGGSVLRPGVLLSAGRDGKPLIDAVAAYESIMLPRGFDTVDPEG
jgi:hypothetical protein